MLSLICQVSKMTERNHRTYLSNELTYPKIHQQEVGKGGSLPHNRFTYFWGCGGGEILGIVPSAASGALYSFESPFLFFLSFFFFFFHFLLSVCYRARQTEVNFSNCFTRIKALLFFHFLNNYCDSRSSEPL